MDIQRSWRKFDKGTAKEQRLKLHSYEENIEREPRGSYMDVMINEELQRFWKINGEQQFDIFP